MEGEILSVSELHAFVNQTLQFAYPLVTVQGEVSSYKVNQGKWVFFDLKDDESVISCFMPIFHLKVALTDGMMIRATSTPNLTKWGKFSLTVRAVELAGEGSVKKAFELLRARFEVEGLFAPERKRALPQYAQRIALVTSRQAAAYNDFVAIVNDRWAGLEIHQAQVQVQGTEAPRQIVRAIEYFNSQAVDYDILVIIRGGGSTEDLQAFNSEDVVRAVYGAKIPTVVGIGHEDDVSLAELVADMRAATPTDAARRITADKNEVITRIYRAIGVIEKACHSRIFYFDTRVDRLNQLFGRLYHSLGNQLDHALLRTAHGMNQIVKQSTQQLVYQSKNLVSLDPRAILQRGYSIAMMGGKVLKDAASIGLRDDVMLQLHQGSLILRRAENDRNEQQISQTRLEI